MNKGQEKHTVDGLTDANIRLRRENKALAERLAAAEKKLNQERVKCEAWMIMAIAADGDHQYGLVYPIALEIALGRKKDDGSLAEFYRGRHLKYFQDRAFELVSDSLVAAQVAPSERPAAEGKTVWRDPAKELPDDEITVLLRLDNEECQLAIGSMVGGVWSECGEELVCAVRGWCHMDEAAQALDVAVEEGTLNAERPTLNAQGGDACDGCLKVGVANCLACVEAEAVRGEAPDGATTNGDGNGDAKGNGGGR